MNHSKAVKLQPVGSRFRGRDETPGAAAWCRFCGMPRLFKGQALHVVEEHQLVPQIVQEVTEAAKTAIDAKGSFSSWV